MSPRRLTRKIRRFLKRFEPDTSWARIRYGIRTFLRHDWQFVMLGIATALAAGAVVWLIVGSFDQTAGMIGGVVAAAIALTEVLILSIQMIRYFMSIATRRPLPPR